jgi:CubicO group peptidase (beta-lactamase class C family)
MIVTTFPGRALDVAVGHDGSIYCIGKGSRRVFEWDEDAGDWDTLSGTPTDARRLTVDRAGTVWVVHEDRTVSRRRSGTWEGLSGRVVDIAAAAQTDDVFCVGLSRRVFQWTESDREWELLDGTPSGVSSVAAERGDDLWVTIGGREMRRFRGGRWSSIPGRALDVATRPGANNQAYVVGLSRRLFDWNEGADRWDIASEMERGGQRLAVEPSGDVITVDTGGRIHRVSTRLSFFNRNIPQEAHERMGSFVDRAMGIRCFAFTPGGDGWVLITSENTVFARNIPDECFDRLNEFIEDGTDIRWVAFPPAGGNRWTIVTENGFFNRNAPEGLHDQMNRMHDRGERITSVAFPPAGGKRWLIITEDGFFARNIDDECYQIMRNINAGRRTVHSVAFEPDGGWLVLADDYYFARNIDEECYDVLGRFRASAREISLVTFDADRRGWSVVSNERRRRVEADRPREFEGEFPDGSVWRTMRANDDVGAAVAVVEDNEIAWTAGYGQIKRGEGHAIHPETVFQVASVSKPITALGVLRLVQDGRLDLDDDVTNIIDADDWSPVRTTDAIRAGARLATNTDPDTCTTAADGGCQNAVTVRRLLAHAGGTTVHGFADFESTPSVTVDDILNGEGEAKNGPVEISYTPGTGADYSGGGYMVLQKLIEEVTGRRFADWMRENVLEPLGMHDSFYTLRVPASYVQDNNAAVAHRSDGSTYNVDRLSDPAFAAASLHSTVLDLARVVIMMNQGGVIDGERFLDADLVEAMLIDTDGVHNGVGRSGLGFMVDRPADRADDGFRYAHGGTCSGFRAEVVGYPNRDAGVIALANRDRTGLARQMIGAAETTYNW